VIGAVLVIVKLLAAVRAVTLRVAAVVVLQVTDSLVPRLLSSITKIWLLAVTAVVLTCTVVAAAATTTEPEGALPQTAGEAELEQLEPVPNADPVIRAEETTFPAIVAVPPLLTENLLTPTN